MEDNRPRLVIADTDYSYLKPLEEEIIRRYAASARVHIITDPDYMEEFFQEHQDISLLMIDEDSYGDFLREHSIRRIYMMAYEFPSDQEYPSHVSVLLKDLPEEVILDRISEALFPSEEKVQTPVQETERKRTKIVSVYSPIGGSGKSMACIALARKLRKLDLKVLVISADPLQSLDALFDSGDHASPQLAEEMKNPTEDIYWTVLQNIGHAGFSYLLPFEKSLPSVGIGPAEISGVVSLLAEKKDFDVIILDIGTILEVDYVRLLTASDLMILITETNTIANRKMQRMLHEPDLLPKCPCILVANEYRSDGLHLSRDSIFGTIAPYGSCEEAMEDPVFYRIALKIGE